MTVAWSSSRVQILSGGGELSHIPGEFLTWLPRRREGSLMPCRRLTVGCSVTSRMRLVQRTQDLYKYSMETGTSGTWALSKLGSSRKAGLHTVFLVNMHEAVCLYLHPCGLLMDKHSSSTGEAKPCNWMLLFLRGLQMNSLKKWKKSTSLTSSTAPSPATSGKSVLQVLRFRVTILTAVTWPWKLMRKSNVSWETKCTELLVISQFRTPAMWTTTPNCFFHCFLCWSMCFIGLIIYIFSRNRLRCSPTLVGEGSCQRASRYQTSVNLPWTKCSVVIPEVRSRTARGVC